MHTCFHRSVSGRSDRISDRPPFSCPSDSAWSRACRSGRNTAAALQFPACPAFDRICFCASRKSQNGQQLTLA